MDDLGTRLTRSMTHLPLFPPHPGSLHLVEEGRRRPQGENGRDQRGARRFPEKVVSGERREGSMGESAYGGPQPMASFVPACLCLTCPPYCFPLLGGFLIGIMECLCSLSAGHIPQTKLLDDLDIKTSRQTPSKSPCWLAHYEQPLRDSFARYFTRFGPRY